MVNLTSVSPQELVSIQGWFLAGPKVRPVQFGALLLAAERLFAKPRCRGPKSNRTSILFPVVLSKGKATKFVRPGGLVNSLVSGTLKI